MRRLGLVIAAVTAIAAYVPVQAQGIDFVHDTTLAQLKKRARELNKPIFIDCYTTWCGPCKWMAKNVFPTDSAGAFYNPNFICAKIDMEKGDGKNIAARYKINAYPSFLFLDTNGTELHRFLGSSTATKFIERGKKALDTENRYSSLQKRYKEGERSPEFIRKYLPQAHGAGVDVQEMFDWYVNSQTDKQLLLAENIALFTDHFRLVRPALFTRVMDQRDAFSQVAGKTAVDNFIRAYYRKEIGSTYYQVHNAQTGYWQQTVNDEKYAEVFTRLSNEKFEGKEDFVRDITIEYYTVKEDIKSLLEFIKKNPITDAAQQNEIAWMVYEQSDNKEHLQQALALSKQSIAQENIYMFNDTYAALCYKLGMKKEARTWAEKAIALGKKEGEDYSSTQQLLEKIKAMK